MIYDRQYGEFYSRNGVIRIELNNECHCSAQIGEIHVDSERTQLIWQSFYEIIITSIINHINMTNPII
jgi:hypothetical protein